MRGKKRKPVSKISVATTSESETFAFLIFSIKITPKDYYNIKSQENTEL